jgi:hypothetical protein
VQLAAIDKQNLNSGVLFAPALKCIAALLVAPFATSAGVWVVPNAVRGITVRRSYSSCHESDQILRYSSRLLVLVFLLVGSYILRIPGIRVLVSDVWTMAYEILTSNPAAEEKILAPKNEITLLQRQLPLISAAKSALFSTIWNAVGSDCVTVANSISDLNTTIVSHLL